jgi:hypothetical protein
MTTVNVSSVTNTVTVTENGSTTVVTTPVASVVTAITAGPQGNAAPGVPSFIQTTQPTVAQLMGFDEYLWWDTSGGDLTLWVEDGEP